MDGPQPGEVKERIFPGAEICQLTDDVLNVLEIRYGMADAVDLLRAHLELG